MCLWESGTGRDGNRERMRERGERKGENEVDVWWFFKKISDCVISVWCLQQLEGDIGLLFAHFQFIVCERRCDWGRGGWMMDGDV